MKRLSIAATVIAASLAFAGTASAASHAKKTDGAAMKTDGAAMAAITGDVKKGKKVFKKCKACHAVGKGAKNKVGPELNGIIGRKVGIGKGYKYSKAFKGKAAEGMVWTVDNLDKYFTKPKKFIPKTKMAFAGVKKKKQRDNLIAYLATFK